jgi:hypothetical protein
LTETVILAVARAAGVEPVDLETPLHESLDPDALNALFRPRPDGSRRSPGSRLQFRTNGFEVVVSSDGTVIVAETGEPDTERI